MATPMCYVLIVCPFYSCRWWQLCDTLIAWFLTDADGDFWVWCYNYVFFYSWRRWLPCVIYELCVFFTAKDDGDSHVWCYNYVYFLQLKMATPMCYVLIVCPFYSCRWWQLCDILIAWFLTDADGDFWVWCLNYAYFLQLKMVTAMCDVWIVCIFYSWRRWRLPCVTL